jgi:hypothetical protein
MPQPAQVGKAADVDRHGKAELVSGCSLHRRPQAPRSVDFVDASPSRRVANLEAAARPRAAVSAPEPL